MVVSKTDDTSVKLGGGEGEDGMVSRDIYEARVDDCRKRDRMEN